MINTIILGNALDVLAKLPAESVNCVTTSPPFWGLRDYGIEPVIWDGDKDCKHIWRGKQGKAPNNSEAEKKDDKWKSFRSEKYLNQKQFEPTTQFCQLCGSWKGSLGLEPTFELYIKHLCDIFDEIKRVLRKDGTCWVNIGDTYAGGSGWTGVPDDWKSVSTGSKQKRFDHDKKNTGIPAKSLIMIPQRFAIEMVNRGWILRNTLIWYKPNCMPSSANDRFTVDFEYLFFFTKNNKAIFWTNEKTLGCVDKKPLGTKGIEGKDWEYKEVGVISKDSFNVRVRDTGKDKYTQKATIEEKEDYKKPKLKKVSLWTGHDYWFEQQFEEYAPATLPRMDRGVNINKWTMGADGQTPHNLSQPRLRKERGYKTKQMDKEINRQQHHGKDINYGKQGRNKRCVWIIPTQPFPEAHFAVYPEELIETPIKAGCPEFICKKCGKAKVKIYKSEIDLSGENFNERQKKIEANIKSGGEKFKRDYLNDPEYRKRLENKKMKIIETDCGCNAGFESGIVLDPFIGVATSALVALKQRKRFIGIEIKQEYIDMANKRIANVQQRIF